MDIEDVHLSRYSTEEFIHGDIAVQIARIQDIFDDDQDWIVKETTANIATGDDDGRLSEWLASMQSAMTSTEIDLPSNSQVSDIQAIENAMIDVQHIDGTWNIPQFEDTMPGVDPNALFTDQRRAYDIIEWHLKEMLANRNPPQLLMIMMGEGGAGKSKVIQTTTDLFEHLQVSNILAKGAYTGIAASFIGGSTLHCLAMIPMNGKSPSMKTLKKLAAFWSEKQYFIIDEMSMLSKTLLSKLSKIIARAKSSEPATNDLPFGGINVILAGDFHQFPPVVTKNNAPLYYPSNVEKDNLEDLHGRDIYEQFNTVVCLRQQIRVHDPVWTDLLRHVRYGNCREEHLKLLRSLIVTNPDCPPTDYQSAPWNDAVIITPRHGVRLQWNAAALRHFCASKNRQIFQCPAEDTSDGKPLSLSEKYAVASSKSIIRQEKTGLASVVEIAVGMKVMVTFNVQTELDIANGARGEIVHIVLDEREQTYETDHPIVKLTYPPAYILVQLNRTKLPALPGLSKNVVPIIPMLRSFSISNGNKGKLNFTRRQLPVTGAYALTDYRGQGQTVVPVYVDIGSPPTGKPLTAFNAYVALSRGRGRDFICLIRDFDDRMFTQHPNEYLRREDERLFEMDGRTATWWTLINKHKQTTGFESSDLET